MAPDQPVSANVLAGVSVNRSSPVPLYFQVAQELQRLIDGAALPSGSRLVNEVEMADRIGVSRPTLRKAIQYLVDRGLLVRKRGVGTQVVRGQVSRSLQLTSMYDDLKGAGRRPTTTLLSAALVEADEDVATRLGMTPGSRVLGLRRLRCADDEPIALLTNYLPPGIVEVEGAADLEQRGLYDLMRAAGVRVRVADQTIGAVSASTEQARLLEERRGAALITMQRVAYDELGRSVEYGTHVYRASRYTFSLTLVGH